MGDLNTVSMTGRVCHDPFHNFTKNGCEKCVFTLACNRYYKNNNTGETEKETSFIAVEAYGNKRVQYLMDTLKKGTKIHVHGYLRQDKWVDEQNNNKERIKIIASDIHPICDRRENYEQQNNVSQNNNEIPDDDATDDIPF